MAAVIFGGMFAAEASEYIYDANGRLVVATDAEGKSARYRYDQMGNLLKVERLDAGDLAVFGFSPGRGAPGVEVEITGHGFSAAIARNTVTFNGVAARVHRASATSLSARVPANASSGPIAVTVGGKTAHSAEAFIVDADAKPPSIDSVGPTILNAGMTLTVDGKALAPIAGQTHVRLGNTLVQPGSLGNTRLTFTVPASAASGKVIVSTPYGVAVSREDVVVPPPGVDAASIESIHRLAVAAPLQALAVSAQGKSLAILLDGEVGDHLSAQFEGIDVASIGYVLYGPVNQRLASGRVSTSRPTFHLPRLPRQGTYLLLLTPEAAPANWKLRLERSRPILVGGPVVRAVMKVAGQSKRLVFSAEQGRNLGLGLSEVAVGTSDHSYVLVDIFKQDGNRWGGGVCYVASGCDFNLGDAPTGVYQLIVIPARHGQTIQFTGTLSSDITAALVKDKPHALNIRRRGQNARLTFEGKAGETVALQIGDSATTPAGGAVAYTVYKPDGTQLASASVTDGGKTFNLPSLPADGHYLLRVDPRHGVAASASIKLTSGVTGVLPIGGASGRYATKTPGQEVHLSFTAEAGQNLGLGLSEMAVSGSGPSHVSVTVRKPDGSYWSSQVCYVSSGCDLNLSNAAAGVHRVIVSPAHHSQTMQFTGTLSSDITAALVKDKPHALSIRRRGQNARLTFEGKAGETVALQIGDSATTPAGGAVAYTVYKPDGTQLASASVTDSSKTFNLPSLPAGGHYLLRVDPRHGVLASSQLRLSAAER